MIQPNLYQAATQDFAAKGRCRIEGFLDSEIAERLYSVLSEKTEYDVTPVVPLHDWFPLNPGERWMPPGDELCNNS